MLQRRQLHGTMGGYFSLVSIVMPFVACRLCQFEAEGEGYRREDTVAAHLVWRFMTQR